MAGRTTFGPFTLDRVRKRLTRDGQAVPISHRGYVVLEALLDADGAPVSKDALMARAWPDMMIEDGNLTVLVSTIRRQLGEDADAMIVTVPRVGYRLVAKADAAGRKEPAGPPLIGSSFANHGSLAEDGYFADGVVDDIITALSRFKSFAVMSRGSTFALREKGADARTAAREFGIRYALEGSIRRMGDRLASPRSCSTRPAIHGFGRPLRWRARRRLHVAGPHYRERSGRDRAYHPTRRDRTCAPQAGVRR